jgi:hypothetical protein
MPYLMKAQEGDVFQVKRYVDAHGNTECVEFVRQVTGAPPRRIGNREPKYLKRQLVLSPEELQSPPSLTESTP